jgi:hypothetical protein
MYTCKYAYKCFLKKSEVIALELVFLVNSFLIFNKLSLILEIEVEIHVINIGK